MALSKEEQDIVDNAKDNFVGFDEKGNAIIKDPKSGALNAYGGSDWSNVTNAIKQQYGDKSYGDYVGSQQMQALGGELQGIDKETGAAVFKKGNETFGIAKDDPAYKDLYKTALQQAGTKTWIDPQYQKEFEMAKQAGNTFQGFDASGKQIYTNALGQYQEVAPDASSGAAKYAKLQLGEQKFAGPKSQSTNIQTGENVSTAPQAQQQRQGTKATQTRSAFEGQAGPYNRFAESQKPLVDLSTPEPKEDKQAPPPVMGSAQALQKQPKAPQTNVYKSFQPPSMQDQLMSMGKGMAEQKIGQAEAAGKQYVQGQATQAAQPYLSQVQDVTGFDPTKSIKGQALQQATSYGKDLAGQQFGADNVSMVSDAAKMLQGNVGQNLVNAAKQEGIRQAGSAAQNFLSGQGMGDTGSALGAGALNTILQGGNVGENLKNTAIEQAKQQALTSGINSLAGAGLSSIPGGAGALASAASSLLGKGSARDKAAAAAQAGTLATMQSALAPLTGGLSYAISPETLAAASKLENKGYDLTKGLLGNTAGSVVGAPLKIGGAGLQAGSEMLGSALGGVGNVVGGALQGGKQALGGLKMLGQGNVGQGISQIGHALANTALNSVVKQPVAVAKQAIHSIGKAIGSIFCFDGNTEILMENGSYKKIKDIKLGDKVEIGGLVTAIGQSASDDIYDYNGVKVSGGHAVFEDNKWTRVHLSKYGKKLDGDTRVVFPMSTEHHIIVTKGQIWADNLEVDKTYDKTDSDILKELNSKKRRNKILNMYVKAKFENK